MCAENTQEYERIGLVMKRVLRSAGIATIPTSDASLKSIGGQYKWAKSLPDCIPVSQKRINGKSGNHLLLLSVIDALEAKYHKLYCLAIRKTLQHHLSVFHGISVSLCTISRYIRRLKEEGFLDCKYRKKRYPDGRIRQRATLFKMLVRGWKYLKSYAITAARKYGFTGLSKSLPDQLFSYEKDYNEPFSASKIEEFCRKRGLTEGLPTTIEGFKEFITTL